MSCLRDELFSFFAVVFTGLLVELLKQPTDLVDGGSECDATKSSKNGKAEGKKKLPLSLSLTHLNTLESWRMPFSLDFPSSLSLSLTHTHTHTQRRKRSKEATHDRRR